MLAPTQLLPSPSADALHADFLSVLPRIQTHARVSFRHLRCPAERDDALAEVAALCWSWFVRLAQRGKDATRFPVVLASFAARQVRCNRGLCGQEPGKDALSRAAQRRHGFRVETLPSAGGVAHERLYGEPHGQRDQDALEEHLQDNTVTPVPEQVAFRLDWPAWLAGRTDRDRRVIESLMVGERALEVSRAHGLTPARVSQLRREFRDDWRAFCGEGPAAEAVAPGADRCAARH